ncbi:MAG: transcription termination/antitermination protein NusA [Clostridia bacterium]|nr:transcription termination/antitermination protein NusA [Clostridia bacterium]
MNSELFHALDLLEREKGISKTYMMEKLEAALVNAYKKEHNGATNIRVAFNPDKKDIKVYQQKTVVEVVEDEETEISLEAARAISRRHKLGGVVEFEIKTDKFSRLAAQAGKQVIIQAIREAERVHVTKQYEEKKEQIITATVYKVDETDGSLVLDTGTSKVVLLQKEQIPGEVYQVNDRLKVYLSEVRSGESKGPIALFSRVHPGLVTCLFALEVPEIQDGTVEIKSISRDPGSRSKIAVASNNPDVDPVGACIGNHGARIAAVLKELGNEKVDVIRYAEDKAEYVKEALSPATVLSVEYDGERCCRVKVAEDQLSLAIGREGQNAKLAAKLTGCKIDIKA